MVEKPFVLTATPIPTSASTTPPMMTNPTRTTTPWPYTVPATTNLFVTRSWPIPPTKENAPAPAKQVENTPARKIIISCPTPSVLSTIGSYTTASNPAANNIMAAPNMKSPEERCKRWSPMCLFCTQSAPHPEPVNSDWL